jgi:hypothetical protein
MTPNDSNPNETSFFNRPDGLARVLALGDSTGDLWSPEEMQAMWQHQLSALLQIDLDSMHAFRLAELKDAPELQRFLAKSFGDLLLDPQPPFELLKITKDFAKETLKSGEDSQLNAIATALYHAAYAAAIVAGQKRLGGMDDAELKRGFEWAVSRVWLDDSTRKLIGQASDSLSSGR